eukprot:gene5579-7566_t
MREAETEPGRSESASSTLVCRPRDSVQGAHGAVSHLRHRSRPSGAADHAPLRYPSTQESSTMKLPFMSPFSRHENLTVPSSTSMVFLPALMTSTISRVSVVEVRPGSCPPIGTTIPDLPSTKIVTGEFEERLGARDLGDTITAALPGAVIGASVAFGDLTLKVEAAKIVDIVRFLRDDPGCRFVNFIDVTAVDYPGREQRFEVVYHLLSPTLNARVRLKAAASETTQVPSIITVFPGADWFEREAYDLYGVIFTGHPDMRRLLTDYGFDGHPLRKDFPLSGFVEVRYDDQE